jgi:hypothetical protein
MIDSKEPFGLAIEQLTKLPRVLIDMQVISRVTNARRYRVRNWACGGSTLLGSSEVWSLEYVLILKGLWFECWSGPLLTITEMLLFVSRLIPAGVCYPG